MSEIIHDSFYLYGAMQVSIARDALVYSGRRPDAAHYMTSLIDSYNEAEWQHDPRDEFVFGAIDDGIGPEYPKNDLVTSLEEFATSTENLYGNVAVQSLIEIINIQ